MKHLFILLAFLHLLFYGCITDKEVKPVQSSIVIEEKQDKPLDKYDYSKDLKALGITIFVCIVLVIGSELIKKKE